MKPKRRFIQIISLMLSGVALVSIMLIGLLWIKFETRRSDEEKANFRRDYISAREAAIRLETDRVCDYIEAQRQSSEIKFLKSIRERVYAAHGLLASAAAASAAAAENPAFARSLMLDALKGLTANRPRGGRYYVSTLSGQQLLGSVDYSQDAADPRWGGVNYFSDPGAFMDTANALSLAKEGFFRYNNLQGLTSGDVSDKSESQAVYLKLFEPYNWIVGLGEYLDEWVVGIQAEMADWAANMAMPEDAYLMILNYNGDILVHPQTSLVGENVYSSSASDPAFKKAVSEIIRKAKNREMDYVSYNAAESSDGAPNERIAYFRAIPAWRWAAATWVNFNDLEKAMAERQGTLADNIRRQIANISLISIALLMVALVLSRLLAGEAARSFAAFFNFFEQAADSSTEIKADEQPFEEFVRLALAANHMINQRKLATALLRESELKFKTIFDVSPQIITISSKDGTLLDANAEYRRFSRLDLAAALGRPLADSFIVPAGTLAELWRVLEAKGSVIGRETAAVDPQGAELTFLTFGKVVHLGSASFALIVFTDITALKAAENEKLALQEKLSRSTQMEAMGLMAAEVAHDLNNILSGIIGYPQLLLMEPNITDKQKESLKEIMNTGQRAAAVVQDLVTIARGVASAKTSLAVNEIVSSYADSPECKNLLALFPAVKLDLDLDARAGNILGSAIHISKVIMNLVSNAVEAFPQERNDGRVTVKTSLEELGDRLDGCQGAVIPGRYARITVQDNGPGIPSGDMDKIFEPFYSKKTKGRSGTGLGLAIVWNAIADHKGYITAASGPTGTVFNLYFKSTDERPAGAAQKKKLDDYKGRGERILVVDDVDIQRKLASKMLSTLGYTPLSVPSGEAAVEFLKKEDVDLVILDMIMRPGINGRETYALIMEFKPRQKAIIASGMAETDDVAQAQAMGAGQFVNKPYTIEDIAIAVKKALSD